MMDGMGESRLSENFKRNLNRGYMKLEVWNDAINLFEFVYKCISRISSLDLKSRSQIIDAAQSVSANIAEGYCRKSINEYLYFLNVASGSLGELLTRIIGLHRVNLITTDDYNSLDEYHYKVENKLLALIKSLNRKRQSGNWLEIID